MRYVALGIVLTCGISLPAAAQFYDPHPRDSTSIRCMDITWMDPSSICEGRALNTASTTMLGSAVWAIAGYVGGTIINTACIGDGEKAAVRGAIGGAGAGLLTGLLTKHVSRRELAEKNARMREESLRHPTKPWSWSDMKSVVVPVAAVAVGGAVIGATQGARANTPCGGIGGGAARGAAVYGGGTVVTVGGALLLVRFFF